MECNKDEAMRAKTKAEEKFNGNDFAAAKRLTLKAQRLDPGLDGLSQMLRTLDVYIFSEMEVNGELDLYGLLDVKPSDDYETIKKLYRNLELMIHPDKNRSVGATGAYIIIRKAWAKLSENTKRSANNSSTESSDVNGHNHRSANTTSKPENYSSTSTYQTSPTPVPTQTQSPPPPPTPTPTPTSFVNGSDTFWTMSNGCKKNYEYLKIHLNQILRCPTCHMPMNFTQQAPQAAEWPPWSPGPYAQNPGSPLNVTQPSPFPTGWTPYYPSPQMQVPMTFNHGWLPSGLGPYAPMPPPNFTHLAAQTNGWAPSGTNSYAQMLMSMNYTQPPSQEPTSWAERQMQILKSRRSL